MINVIEFNIKAIKLILLRKRRRKISKHEKCFWNDSFSYKSELANESIYRLHDIHRDTARTFDALEINKKIFRVRKFFGLI